MEKIIMLGTGNGATMDLYNTCFVIQNEKGNFLIDTGGSIEIIKRLNKFNINIYKDIKNIFISHSHTDHILGLIWMFKKLGRASVNGEETNKINIYCNDVVYEAIMGISNYVLPKKLVTGIESIVDFHILNDNEKLEINGTEYTFFDINAKGTKQYGFECVLNGKKLVFLGDETIKPSSYERVKKSDYVMHEAFCLDSEEIKFGAYQKNHSTVKTASEIMNELEVKNLILYHTEETHGKERKKLYTQEGKEYFKGNVIVPDDFEIIEL